MLTQVVGKSYPPRVKIIVDMNNCNTSFKLPVKFIGCSEQCKLDSELLFPLGNCNLLYKNIERFFIF